MGESWETALASPCKVDLQRTQKLTCGRKKKLSVVNQCKSVPHSARGRKAAVEARRAGNTRGLFRWRRGWRRAWNKDLSAFDISHRMSVGKRFVTILTEINRIHKVVALPAWIPRGVNTQIVLISAKMNVNFGDRTKYLSSVGRISCSQPSQPIRSSIGVGALPPAGTTRTYCLRSASFCACLACFPSWSKDLATSRSLWWL